MKKIITLSLFAALFCAVSCQHGLDNGQDLSNGLKVEAVISQFGDTRVDYIPQNSEEPYYIDAFWHVGDVVFGFDDQGQKFDFTVESVAAGVATLNIGSYVPGAATTLHAIYYPGKSSTDLEGDSPNYSLPVNLDAQSGELDGDSPVLMCATSAISAGSVSFTFNSETAIIGVTRFKLPADATITSIELEGVVTGGTIEVDGGGSLVLTPDGTRRSVTATGSWATSGQICTTAVYFASLPTADAYLVLNATDDSANEYANVSTIAQKTIEAGLYYYTEKILDAPVAEVAGVNYGTIDEAFAAANRATSAVTITLLADCISAGMLSLNSTASGTGAVTLDLNGRTLTVTPTDTKGIEIAGTRSLTVRDGASGGKIVSSARYMVYATGTAPGSPIKQFILQSGSLNGTYTGSNNSTALHLITNNGNFEITGGSISATNTNYRGIYVGNNSTLDVNNLTVNTSAYCVYVASGTINLDGGTFNRTGTYCVYTSEETSVANISAGTYTQTSSGNPLIYAGKGEINVTGGYFEAVNVRPVNCEGTSASDGVAYVTDGCFNKPLMTEVLKDKGANEYVNVHNTDGGTSGTYPFTVSAVSSTPKVADLAQDPFTWDFGTIEGAMKGADVRAKANGNSTVTLTADCTASSTMSVSAGNTYSVTLDLAGYDITSTALGSAITTASNFVLTDSGATSGEINSTATALAVTAGTATVNSGSLYGATNAASVSSGASLTIIDGYFYGNGAADITGAGTVTVNGGCFRYSPESWCPASAAVTSSSELFNTRTYNYRVEYAAATVNGVGYPTLAAAAEAAVAYDGASETVTLQLQDDLEYNSVLNLTHASKPVVLDLNGHSLSTSAAPFITSSDTLTITDSQFNPVEGTSIHGMITSSQDSVILIDTDNANLTIRNCKIACTAPDNEKLQDGAAVVQKATCTVSIENAVIYTTNKVTAVLCHKGNLNISGENTEIACTKEGGFPAVSTISGTNSVAGNSAIIITGGKFYSNITGATNRESHLSTVNLGYYYDNTKYQYTGTLKIQGGYFYAANTSNHYSVRAKYLTRIPNITVEGGYYNTEPHNNITFPTGYEKQTLSPAATCRFNMIPGISGTDYSFGYTVGEVSIPE